MKTCNECKYADWNRTTSGRLHPSGDGFCTYKLTPQIPNAFSIIKVGGGISRRRTYNIRCPYWAKDEAKKDAQP